MIEPQALAQPSDQAGPTSFKTELVNHLPALRAFARSLCGNVSRADDLTQEALFKAWANKESFQSGTNMKAWLFVILRNCFYTELRRRKHEVEDPGDIHAAKLSVEPRQHDGLELIDLHRGLTHLPAKQREALILVGASGCSYEEAAEICGCAVGTIKSRVSRARSALLVYFGSPSEDADSGGIEDVRNKSSKPPSALLGVRVES